MSKRRAAITAIQGYVPEDKLTNFDLEKMVDTNDEWIRTRTGIEERRILKDPTKATSDLGAEAVKGLLQKTGTSPDEIDMLICSTATPDHLFSGYGKYYFRQMRNQECMVLRCNGSLQRFYLRPDYCQSVYRNG